MDLDLLVRVTVGDVGAARLRALSQSPLRGAARALAVKDVLEDIENYLDETSRDVVIL